MTPELARDIAHVAAAESRQVIVAVLAATTFTPHRRCLIEKVRDQLHETCQRYEAGELAETYEEHYLPLFDALAAVTDALTVAGLRTDRLRLAVRRLDDCRQEGVCR